MSADVSQIKIPDPACISGADLEAKAETVAVGKANQPTGRCIALAFMAGMFIAMGALFMTVIKSDTTLPFAAAQILGGLGFSLGLICVIVAGAELFTGNCLMLCATASKRISVGALVKNLVLVWLGNLVGSLVIVALLVAADVPSMNGGAVGDTMIAVAASKIDLSWSVIFFRGIMCNVLVCLAVWMGFADKTVIDKIFTSIFPVMAFVACGFEHCVANMYFLPMGVVAKMLNPDYAGAANIDVLNLGGICWNISAATLGNIVGGMLFVAFIYWLAYAKKKG